MILKTICRLFEKEKEEPPRVDFTAQDERLDKARQHLVNALKDTERASEILSDLVGRENRENP